MREILQMRTEYVDKVMTGKYNKKQAEEELQKMEKKFGDGAFTSFIETRKSKPWDIEHLKELETMFIAGAASREFFEYMAEVAEDIYNERRRKGFIWIMGIGFVVILLIVIIFKLLPVYE